MQGLRDRLLVWCSHCEVQLQQIESDAVGTDPWDVLKKLNEELDLLDENRTEIRDLARSLIENGVDEMRASLEEYLNVEDGVLSKLSQAQIRLAQRELDRQSSVRQLGQASLTDSGVFSYEKLATGSPFVPPVRQSETGARARSYADVAKSPARESPPSSVRSTPPPPVSVKSDTQRHLELALDEWRQRLVRLDRLIKATAGSEPSADVANNIVRFRVSFIINPRVKTVVLKQARVVSSCRSSQDLSQHLTKRMTSEVTGNGSPTGLDRLEAFNRQIGSLSDEFLQLETLAKTREQDLRDER